MSADTLLRMVRQHGTCVCTSELRSIGVDDWALKRGRTYGTIIVNLETHRVVELLPDRTAETLAAWLRNYPSIERVTRDRSTDYSAGFGKARHTQSKLRIVGICC
ncbi:MAG: transposase [Chloroflexi bacterium]|nr:transposase [Chloroflexota bacterium]